MQRNYRMEGEGGNDDHDSVLLVFILIQFPKNLSSEIVPIKVELYNDAFFQNSKPYYLV